MGTAEVSQKHRNLLLRVPRPGKDHLPLERTFYAGTNFIHLVHGAGRPRLGLWKQHGQATNPLLSPRWFRSLSHSRVLSERQADLEGDCREFLRSLMRKGTLAQRRIFIDIINAVLQGSTPPSGRVVCSSWHPPLFSPAPVLPRNLVTSPPVMVFFWQQGKA